jgi:hypothetical protein
VWLVVVAVVVVPPAGVRWASSLVVCELGRAATAEGLPARALQVLPRYPQQQQQQQQQQGRRGSCGRVVVRLVVPLRWRQQGALSDLGGGSCPSALLRVEKAQVCCHSGTQTALPWVLSTPPSCSLCMGMGMGVRGMGPVVRTHVHCVEHTQLGQQHRGGAVQPLQPVQHHATQRRSSNSQALNPLIARGQPLPCTALHSTHVHPKTAPYRFGEHNRPALLPFLSRRRVGSKVHCAAAFLL